MVNYHSSVYIKWQLKILHEFNTENDFDLIIIDNSNNINEFKKLKSLTNTYPNVKLVKYTPKCKTASGQHGEGLDKIRKIANSKYLIVQDPDFFWLKKNYLSWLESLLQYNDAVGIPYPKTVLEGQARFPGAFGCAYPLEKIKDISFKAYINDDVEYSEGKFLEFRKNNSMGKKYDFPYDVGWSLRKKLSKKHNHNFISFYQKEIFNAIGEELSQNTKYSFETNSRVYYHNNNIVCLHLFRGTFTGRVEDNKDTNNVISDTLYKVRNDIAQFIYQSIKKDDFSFTQRSSKNINILDEILKASNSKRLCIAFIFLFLKNIRIIRFFIPFRKKTIIKIINKVVNNS